MICQHFLILIKCCKSFSNWYHKILAIHFSRVLAFLSCDRHPRETVRILFEHTATTGNGIFCQKEFIHSAQRAKCFAESTHLPTVQEFETETIDYYPTFLSTRVKEAFRKET
jgi:hypothetical protein